MKGLILIDWDNTISNGSGEITDARLPSTLQNKIEEGWLVGLNSDTPLMRLLSWWDKLNLNGPIIAEKGAVIWWPGGDQLFVSTLHDVFIRFRTDVLSWFTGQPHYAVMVGDNTQFVESVTFINSLDTVLVAVDAYRLCSLGLFVRRISDGPILLDVDLTMAVAHVLDMLRPAQNQVSPIHINKERCFLSVNALDVDKTSGLQALLLHWERPQEIIMIGDSMSDYLSVTGVRHFAVSNAEPEFKRRSEAVAISQFTSGCVELLAKI